MRSSKSIVMGSVVAGLIFVLPFKFAPAQTQANVACGMAPLMNQHRDAATIQHLETSWNVAIAQGDAGFESRETSRHLAVARLRRNI